MIQKIDFCFGAVPRMGGALLVLSSSSWPTAALMECSTSLIFWVAVSSHERPHAAIYAISLSSSRCPSVVRFDLFPIFLFERRGDFFFVLFCFVFINNIFFNFKIEFVNQ
jgi:hypothetical protein